MVCYNQKKPVYLTAVTAGNVFRTITDGLVCVRAHVSGCSLPLGMQRRLIPDNQISASTFRQSWRNSWSPGLARLNQDGSANAWRPKVLPDKLIQISIYIYAAYTVLIQASIISVSIPLFIYPCITDA